MDRTLTLTLTVRTPSFRVRVLIVVAVIFLLVLALSATLLRLARSDLGTAAIAEITIPSRSNTGVVFQAPVTGTYVFEYAGGEFLVYDLSPGAGCDRSAPGCYSAMVLAYPGTTVRWRGNIIDEDVALFVLGEPNIGWTLDEAQAQVVGKRQSVRLRAGQQITLVAGDLRDFYDDNTGEILLRVYFVPVR